MKLGNHRVTDKVVVNGEVVGYTESSDDLRVGKHCVGATYDGESVGRIALDFSAADGVECEITDLRRGDFMFEMGGVGKLDDWEKLFEDALHHIRRLKGGHRL